MIVLKSYIGMRKEKKKNKPLQACLKRPALSSHKADKDSERNENYHSISLMNMDVKS